MDRSRAHSLRRILRPRPTTHQRRYAWLCPPPCARSPRSNRSVVGARVRTRRAAACALFCPHTALPGERLRGIRFHRFSEGARVPPQAWPVDSGGTAGEWLRHHEQRRTKTQCERDEITVRRPAGSCLQRKLHHTSHMNRGSNMALQGTRAVFIFSPQAALLTGALAFLALPNAAHATEEHATQTGMKCAQCHQSAKGGKKLNSFGKKFKANGDKLPTAAK